MKYAIIKLIIAKFTRITMSDIREPAVAGQFYPANAAELTKIVRACLDKAMPEAKAPPVLPKAIITPHAGFIYSGDIAANAYACLSELKTKIKKMKAQHQPLHANKL